LVGAGRLEEVPGRHLGFATGLAVDRPGGAVVVGRRLASVLVAVGEDRKAKLRVLVKHLPGRRRVVDVLLDEFLVGEEALKDRAYLLAAAGARVGFKDAVAFL